MKFIDTLEAGLQIKSKSEGYSSILSILLHSRLYVYCVYTHIHVYIITKFYNTHGAFQKCIIFL